MKIITTNDKQIHDVEFDGRKFLSKSLKLKDLKEQLLEELVVLCEDDESFANVFSSFNDGGGYAIYWYSLSDLEQFLKGDGAVELEELDGAQCIGSLRDALEWAYTKE